MTVERGQGRWALVGEELDQDSCRQEHATATVQWGWLATVLCLCVFVCKKMHCIAFFIGFFRHIVHFPRHKWCHKCKAHPFLHMCFSFYFKHDVYHLHTMHFTSLAFVFGIVLSERIFCTLFEFLVLAIFLNGLLP